MSENEEPDWLAELAKGGEALQHEAMRIVKAAEKFAESGPARPLTRRIVRAVSASIRELAAPEPVVHYVSGSATAMATATASLEVVRAITGSGSVALHPIRAGGQGGVRKPTRGQAERDIGYILALMLIAFVTGGLLGVAESDRPTVDHYMAVISTMLPIAYFIWSRWNKPK
jgi:hypothetical protein